jgi:hypothetical protein
LGGEYDKTIEMIEILERPMDADLFAQASWGSVMPRNVEHEGYQVQQKVRPLGSGIARAGGACLPFGRELLQRRHGGKIQTAQQTRLILRFRFATTSMQETKDMEVEYREALTAWSIPRWALGSQTSTSQVVFQHVVCTDNTHLCILKRFFRIRCCFQIQIYSRSCNAVQCLNV